MTSLRPTFLITRRKHFQAIDPRPLPNEFGRLRKRWQPPPPDDPPWEMLEPLSEGDDGNDDASVEFEVDMEVPVVPTPQATPPPPPVFADFAAASDGEFDVDVDFDFPDDLASSSEQPDEERRAYSRQPLDIEVSYTSHHNFYTGFTNDISEGGLFIATFGRFSVGDRLTLNLSMPGLSNRRAVEVEVRWVRSLGTEPTAASGIGVKFVDLDSNLLGAIRTFINKREAMFYDE